MEGELDPFDVISVTETWLASTVKIHSLHFKNFCSPFRKDRITDNHGGMLVKSQIPVTRRHDLEIQIVECIWHELLLKNKKLL